jgi:NAD(P)-dependent dehydrogenase (short-subunit alcohol dehydrogenase family)
MIISAATAANVIETCSTNRVALVTGANKGIGFCIALQLALSGHFQEVILGCRDAGRGQRAVQEIQQNLLSVSSETLVSFLPLEVGNKTSHSQFRQLLEEKLSDDKKLHVLVNNAAIAFKGSDPTPHHKQVKPTLDVNFRGTVDLTEGLLPLLRRGNDARIVNVASMAGYLQQIKSSELRDQFTDPILTMEQLHSLVNKYEQDVQSRDQLQNGWGSSNYGFSKLALIAATKIWAREESVVKVNCFCPGYCDTDMTSHKGTRSPSDGAKAAVLLATMKDCPTGEFYRDMQPAEW